MSFTNFTDTSIGILLVLSLLLGVQIINFNAQGRVGINAVAIGVSTLLIVQSIFLLRVLFYMNGQKRINSK